ncbi:MAG: nucleotide exchange factor GrpE [Pseudomonadota bacterium]
MTKKEHSEKRPEEHKKQAAYPKPEQKPEQIAGEDLGEQIRAAEEEAKHHYDKLLRVMAEFENFKKRMGKERDDLIRYSNEKILAEFLPSLDDLDRVLEHVPMDASDEVRKFADGVALARKTLGATLEKFGLKEVPAQGEPFDPAQHEAIAAVDSDAYEPNTVMAVHRKGYFLFDRLLRPAMVTVAK